MSFPTTTAHYQSLPALVPFADKAPKRSHNSVDEVSKSEGRSILITPTNAGHNATSEKFTFDHHSIKDTIQCPKPGNPFLVELFFFVFLIFSGALEGLFHASCGGFFCGRREGRREGWEVDGEGGSGRGGGEGRERRRSEPLDDRMSEGYTSFESVAQCAALTRLCHCRQSRPSCHYLAEVRPSLYVGQTEREKTSDTGDAALKSLATLENAHLELQRMCARPLKCRSSSLSTPCPRESSASTNPWTSLPPGGTTSPSFGRERQESVALHTLLKEDVIGPCRKRRHPTPTRQSPPRASP